MAEPNNKFYYMAKSVFALRLVHLRSLTYRTGVQAI